jgi:DNA ligase (NAD+)
MDIEGLGEQIAAQLVRRELVQNVADLYDLTLEQLGSLWQKPGKAAQSLLDNIEKSKRRPLPNVLFALGIRHVGFETARLLAQHFGDLQALLGASPEELRQVEGIGPIVASGIVDWYARPENREVVERLRAAGVNTTMERAAAPAGPLAGLTIVVTGRLDRISRLDAEDRIRALGGKVGSSVTKGTDYLVVGEEAGSKLTKAQQLGTKLLDEEAFLGLLDGQAPGANTPPGPA